MAEQEKARAVSAKPVKSPAKGTPGLQVVFESVFDERRWTWEPWFSDKTRDRIIESLKHCGMTDKEIATLDFTNIGRNEVSLKIDDNDDTKVAFVNGGTLGVKMSGADEEHFRQLLGAALNAPSVEAKEEELPPELRGL